MNPLSSTWTSAGTVAGFAASPPNETLLEFAAAERRRHGGNRLLDIGCGAARNAVVLAEHGWHVLGLDFSRPMLDAAARRALDAGVSSRVWLATAAMDHLPVADGSMDFVVAHGIWNLARSAAEFRRAVREAARIARPGAALFLFTFSRHTLAEGATPVPGETFVFSQFSGEPQCFLTEAQLRAELAEAGFLPDAAVPLTELNRPRPGSISIGRAPVIYQAAFRRTQAGT
jgi:ubiquinone/menaquinone biosynthesis C-methylase UbiE